MKSKICIPFLILVLFLLISSCTQEKKEDYSGVSELISDRNKARYKVKEENSSKKVIQPSKAAKTKPSILNSTQKEDEISSIVLYEQNIQIIGEASGKVMAKGVAYINKQGQIVKIKIIR